MADIITQQGVAKPRTVSPDSRSTLSNTPITKQLKINAFYRTNKIAQNKKLTLIWYRHYNYGKHYLQKKNTFTHHHTKTIGYFLNKI